MIAYFKRFVNIFNKPKFYLILANILLFFFLILLSNLNVLPVRNIGDFLFFTIIFLLFALYRPGWSFLFFVGTIALENINLAPESIGIMIRPFQFFGALTALALIVRVIFKRLNFKLPKFCWYDLLFIIFAIAGFVSSLGALNKTPSLKQSVIAVSFVAFYFLVRIFVQNIGDLKRIIPFFLSSSIIVIIYGIWQNVRFMTGLSSFEVMPGRPNGTFTEADWLGIYIVFLVAIVSALIYYFSNISNDKASPIFNFQFSIFNKFTISKFSNLLLYLLLASYFLLLILTVSRSAWLGAAVVTFVFLLAFIIEKQWKQFLKQAIFVAIAVGISISAIYVFNLTNFQLFNRAQSTGSGLQKITVSCASNVELPNRINTTYDLAQYNCRHINLEEIESEKLTGNFVKEVYRQDPNVNIRGEIYKKSWAEIKKHPILGIGWGNINSILGADEKGTSFNSSNIFLEIWLGSGIFGVLALFLAWTYVLIRAVKHFFKSDPEEKSLGLFLFLGTFALLVPNLFNAGIFLAVIWLFFGIGIIKDKNN